MAERRMFCKSVVESDQFTEMPAEAQALYLHLNMAADDDGFCGSPRKIMRSCGASNDSMKILLAKKFVLSFEKGDNFVVVIKHWRMNNYIRKDTYHETRYKEFMRELYYDENQSYSTNPDEGHVPVVQEALPPRASDDDETVPSRGRDEHVDEPSTQDRLGNSKDIVRLEEGKDRIGKGEYEGENPSGLSGEERIERIKHWKGRIDFMNRMNYNNYGMYALARAEGISAEEIDSFKEE